MTNCGLRNKLLSVLLALAMIIGMVPAISGNAYAETGVQTFDFSSPEKQKKVGTINYDGTISTLCNDNGVINLSIKDDGDDEECFVGLQYCGDSYLFIYGENSELKLTADEGYSIKDVEFELHQHGGFYNGFDFCYSTVDLWLEDNNYSVSPGNYKYSYLINHDEAYESYCYPQGTDEVKLSCKNSWSYTKISAIKVTYTTSDATDEWANSSASLAVHGKATKKTITYNWDTVSGASHYKVFFNKSGSKYTCKKVTITDRDVTTYKKTGLKSGCKYKAYVAAYDKNGERIAKSETIYVKTK